MLLAGALLLGRLLRGGVLAAGAREAVRSATPRGAAACAATAVRPPLAVPLQGRELRLWPGIARSSSRP